VLSQAIDVARESGRPVGGAGVDVDLEQLPAYEEAAGGQGAPVAVQRPTPISPGRGRGQRVAPAANNGVVGLGGEGSVRPGATESEVPPPPPDEPPPGYDEVQQSSVARNLERSVEKGG